MCLSGSGLNKHLIYHEVLIHSYTIFDLITVVGCAKSISWGDLDMNILRRTVALMLILMVTVSFAGAQEEAADLAPLGFQFGISKKDAKKLIDSKGKRIVEDKVDSKKIRMIVMQGVIVDIPVNPKGLDVQTSLEFYNKKLLSTSLIFNAEDSPTEEWIEEAFSEYLNDRYGAPTETDEMMYFKSWTWHLPKVKLVLHTNTKNNVVKVDYTYQPINQAKFEKELNQKRGDKAQDPAKQMFLDGDYSKPTNYDDRYRTPDYSSYEE